MDTVTKDIEDEQVVDVPNDNVIDEQAIKFTDAVIEKSSDGSFTAIASTNAIDRHGEIVDNNGWDLKSYKKNPVILWAHDHSEPAIGTAKKVWVDGEGKKAKLMIQPVLHDVTEKARAIKALVENGIIKTLSVGFKPLESPDGVTFTKNELLEVSMVNVPANAEAMTLAYKSLKEAGFEEKTMKEIGIPTEVIDRIDQLEKDVEELRNQVKAKIVNPERKEVNQRLSMLKVIARATDKILEGEKKNLPKSNRIELAKVIKKANELVTKKDLEKIR